MMNLTFMATKSNDFPQKTDKDQKASKAKTTLKTYENPKSKYFPMKHLQSGSKTEEKQKSKIK